jgi:hypothetical protein
MDATPQDETARLIELIRAHVPRAHWNPRADGRQLRIAGLRLDGVDPVEVGGRAYRIVRYTCQIVDDRGGLAVLRTVTARVRVSAEGLAIDDEAALDVRTEALCVDVPDITDLMESVSE